MSKFTPGPWNFHAETGSIDTDEGYTICELAFGFSSLDDAELEQDGQLIAAAPALYEALKDVYRIVGQGGSAHSIYTQVRTRVDTALALVGEQT